MEIKVYEYKGYTIEIHQNPIYKDYEYVVKNSKGVVTCASCHVFENFDEVQIAAELKVNEYINS